ncbi:DUF4190 domain-containing protein [Actinomadura logoneensis]|uniref:DUF4190 domain-containing protein n=1 Tax=Actinomadura logoneensis TaxID=2293572 RepID=A0A372JR33_9ACTN|nr:DUF4190 domain-containing protein [Actinomadura logoneensis]RFU42409.1 DUF4190 domain-containing protein [Actinomadura logoneensis]
MNEQPGTSGQSTGQDPWRPSEPQDPAPGGPVPPGAAEQAARRALWLGVGSLVITLFFWPFGLVLGIAALVVGTRARRLSAERPRPLPGLTGGMVSGALSVVLGVLMLGFAVYLWPEVSGLENCKSTANTQTDRQACEDKWLPEIARKLHVRTSDLDPLKGML